MLRDLLNILDPSRPSQREVLRLLARLASADETDRKLAEKSLDAIFYPDPFEGRPRLMYWPEYSAVVRKHAEQIRASPLVEPLLGALDGEDQAARLFAIRALAANQEPQAFDRIVAALGDKSSEIRAAAATQLMHYRDRRAVGPLIATLLDPFEEPRQFAANTLGFIADAQAIGPLLQLLASRVWRDRSCALYALARVCDEPSVQIIRPYLRDPVKRVRKAAKAALADYDRRRRETLPRAVKID